MLFDMCQDRIEVDWILPRINNYEADLNRIKSAAQARKAFYMIWKEAKINVSKSKKASYAGFVSGDHRKFVNTLRAFYPDRLKIFNLHLFANEVDEFLKSICDDNGYEYVKLEQVDFTIKNKVKEVKISLHPNQSYSLKAEMVKKAYEESKIVLSIKEAITDRKIIKQSLLKRIKERRAN